jgi:hypothetical protein
MSSLSQFMHTARAILDEQDRKAAAPAKDQPPFFVRTTWLFAELELLAPPSEEEIFKGMKIARLGRDIKAVLPLLDQIEANTKAMDAGQRRHEREQLVTWIREQIGREPGHGG